MSTQYRPLKKIAACDLFDGRLEEFNVREDVRRDTTEHARCLTDGKAKVAPRSDTSRGKNKPRCPK